MGQERCLGTEEIRAAGETVALAGMLIDWALALVVLFPLTFFIPFAQFLIRRHRRTILRLAAKVGPDQYPAVHELVQEAARRLSMAAPDVFVIQDSRIRAYVFGFTQVSPHHFPLRGLRDRSETWAALANTASRLVNWWISTAMMVARPLSVVLSKGGGFPPTVVLYSGMIAAMSRAELLFVLGHELAHVRLGHTNWLQFSELGSKTSRWPKLAEFSADLGGLRSCDDLEASVAALSKVRDRLNRVTDPPDPNDPNGGTQLVEPQFLCFSSSFRSDRFMDERIERLRNFQKSPDVGRATNRVQSA